MESAHPAKSASFRGPHAKESTLDPVDEKDLLYSTPPPSVENNRTDPSSQPTANSDRASAARKHQAAPPYASRTFL